MHNIKDCPVLVTGGCGMVGSHIVDYYFNKNEKITATYYTHPTINLEEVINKANYIACDVCDGSKVFEIIDKLRPNIIYHLAAQSLPVVSWEKPGETINANVNGTIHVMEAVKKIRVKQPNYDPVIVIACSSAEYGAALTPENSPVSENSALLPLHPYGVSKVGQDLLGFQYYQNDKIKTVRARIFNTTGPRKINDAVSDFTKRAVLWEKGKIESVTVGNIYTKRAITDVRDLVQALVLLAEKAEPGEVYNISGSKVYLIKDILDIIAQKLSKSFPIETDAKLIRPSDEPIIFGDSTKLINATEWKQQYSIEQTISDMIDYWRSVLV